LTLIPEGLAGPLAAAFVLGALVGAAVALLWRGSTAGLARRVLRETEGLRQAETEALLDGVKAAFGDISLATLTQVAGQLQAQAQGALAAERRLLAHEQRSERAEHDARLMAVGAQLERLRELVQALERDREGKFRALDAALRQGEVRGQALEGATRRLAELLGSSRRRGQWGERLAEDVLRFAGLEEHVSWRRQAATADGRRPDFTILLPGGGLLAMDVKFPLENLQKAQEADDREGRARAEAAFVRDVRARIQEVRERGYGAAEAGGLDLALLFLPSEDVLAAVVRLAPELPDEALASGIVLVSPLTLVAVLAVLRRAAVALALDRGARELGVALAELEGAFAAWTAEATQAQRRLDEAAAGFRALATARAVRLERAMARLAALADERARPQGVPARDSIMPSRAGGSGVSTAESNP
jgi:DNA recombination protein RmuC